MAAVPCSKCTAERKGFRRELDSWRYKLIHCVGFESILEGIYGPMLTRDLNLFNDCEPEAVADWSPEANCSFCSLPLDKLSVVAPATALPLPSPSDFSLCQAPNISESSQTAHKFLQAVFHKNDASVRCDASIPRIAQDLMKKMIRQFAMEYASKCLLRTTSTEVTTRSSSPFSSETSDVPLDLTVSRTKEETERESDADGVLDLSQKNDVSTTSSNVIALGRQLGQKEYIERSLDLSEGLLSKALKDVHSGRLQEQRAALLYGIPLRTLRHGLEDRSGERSAVPRRVAQSGRDSSEGMTSYNATPLTLGGEARLVLQKVAAWAERAEVGGDAEENGELAFPLSRLPFDQPSVFQKTLPRSCPQLRDALQPPPSPTPSLEAPAPLRIPQVRSVSNRSRLAPAEIHGPTENRRTSPTHGAARPSSCFKLSSPFPARGCAGRADLSPLQRSSSMDESEEGADRRDKDKPARKKRGRYRQYDHELMEEAIAMVMAGRMSVSKAQGVYGVPHSTLEYKVKERTGTLKNPPKKKSASFCSSGTNLSGLGTLPGSANSGPLASPAAKMF
ncbi:ligand-dependent nuclear receptor corepressor-like protein isoform X3 [Syngnathoides biaculeatus]|uniref:ligand-dependent nuclear receptor corepressor-like protein isoform X3 n=1 Tax=Syngnathoides biaculeatus TaxID=300417 RepID=UPI002ADDA106|nr:ligand-dependent nuclear receptor corepressor-like protein isoform X3 [Syngnathoides biaculeatus]